MYADTHSNRRCISIPAGVKLRECSIVIIGSTCKICGRDFKCESDVALHARWRHNQIIETINNSFGDYFENIGSKCEICGAHLGTIADLRAHKRQTHKKQIQDRRRTRKLRLVFKIAGVTMTEVRLNRKYLKVRENGYLVNTATQTDSLENKKHQDDYVANIDLSFADRVVGNSRIQCVRLYKATNRYIVGKFASIQGDAIARSTSGVPKRSLVEISNTPSRDAISGTSNGPCEEYGNHDLAPSQEDTTDTFAAILADTIGIHDKENSRWLNERERRNANSAAESTLIWKNKNVYCSNEITLDDPKEFLAYQRDKTNRTTSTSKENSCLSNENYCDIIGRSNEVSKDRIFNGSSSLIEEEIVIDNENDNNSDGDISKCSAVSLTAFNEEHKSANVDMSVDDDIQEVLRITREKGQTDINHESPNRTEREMLLQSAIKEMCIPCAPLGTIYPEKNDAGFMANNDNDDVGSINAPRCIAIANKNCQFPANMTTLLYKTFDEKLDICLNNLHHYGIRYYNDLSEINNNSLEEYAMHTHEGFFESWMLETRSQYTSEMKNDNEATIVID